MTWAAYLTFSAAAGILVGLGTWGLVFVARRLARLPAHRASLIYVGLPVPGVLLAILGLLAGSVLMSKGPEEYGPGASIVGVEAIVIPVATLLGCATIGILLAIGRKSVRVMSALVVTVAIAGWSVAGIETFWLGDFVTRHQIFDPNAYASGLGWVSTLLFGAAASGTAWRCSQKRTWDAIRDAERV